VATRAGGAQLAPLTAGFGPRLLARLIDGVLIGLPLFALEAALGFSWTAVVLAGLVGMVYEVGLIARRGQTVGKRVMGVAVTTSATHELPTLFQSFVRWLLPGVAALAPGLFSLLGALIVYLPMFFDPMRRGLHDQLAGTRVVVVTADGG
jgi:uncharacterized RDD family membrane protein YckC